MPITRLIELQDIDSKLEDLNSLLGDLPKMVDELNEKEDSLKSKIESDISTYSYYLDNNDNQKVPIVKVENFEIKSVSNQF